MINKSVRLINIAIVITILIGSLLFFQQQHFHTAFSRDINASLEKRNMDSLELALQEGLIYPLGSGDRLAVARMTDKFIRNDYIYSIEVRDSNGELIASATSENVPTERGVKIYTRTVKIIDDRPIDSLDLDDDSPTQTLRGTVKLRLTTYETQDRLDSALTLHWIVLSGAIFLIGFLVIAFTFVFRRGTKRTQLALEKIARKQYVTINDRFWIREIDEIVQGVNTLSSTLEKSELDFDKTNSIKEALLRMLSKELENPMRTLHGLLSLINESISDDDLDAEIIRYLRTCQLTSESVVGMLDQLKVFNLLDLENLKYKESSIYPEAFFDSLYDEFSLEIKTTISFDIVSMPHHNPELSQAFVMTDEHKLLVVARNILANAAKYTSRGSIRVEWSLESSQNVSQLVMTFEDTGIGIEASNVHRVFEEYFRESPDISGFGLGLTVVKSYLDVLGGKIKIQSLKNMGTKVEVSIPVRTIDASVPVLGKLPQYDLTALVIDDNENTCRYLAQILNQYGVNTDVLRNPTQALTAIAEGSFALVFIDDRMNQVRGLDLARHVVATGKEVAIVYMTWQSAEEGRAAIIDSMDTTDAEVFSLHKPLIQKDVEQIIRRVSEIRTRLTEIRTTLNDAYARRYEPSGKNEKDK